MKAKFLFIFMCFLYVKAHAQEIKYTNCDTCWNSDSLGNHRAVVQYTGTGNVAKVEINWRRRDNDPQNKRIIIEDAKTHQNIANVKTGIVNREYGEIYFEPISSSGIYYVYYLPYKNEGRSNYPKGVYLEPEATAAANWLQSIKDSSINLNAFVTEIQSIDAFNSFYPMEVIATAKETENLKGKYTGKAFLVFPEDRQYSIRMKTDLPQRWIQKGVQPSFNGEAARGEYYTYQLGVYALQELKNVQVQFTNLKTADGKLIPEKNSISINTNGTTYDAKPLVKRIDIAQNEVQPL